jgi:hypothetical protein
MGVGRVSALVLSGVALLWGGLFLTEPFRYFEPVPCQPQQRCPAEGPYMACGPPLAGADLEHADPGMAAGAAERCARGGAWRLGVVGALVGAPLAGVVVSSLPRVRRRWA